MTSPNGRARPLSLSGPDIGPREIEAVLRVLNSPQLSIGPMIEAFEQAMASYLGRRHAVAVNSGTSGLHLCIRAAGIGEGDEVITTPFSFVASANCMLFERARPVFVDIEETTLNIDVGRIEAAITPRTKALLPVHVFGQPCDMVSLMEIARRRNVVVIEDACEALGAVRDERRAGAWGDAAVFGFYPNKQITTGEGGIIATDDRELDRLYRSLRNQGRAEESGDNWLSHARLGYNYRLDELSSALGLIQLERIGELLARRARVATRYNERLASVEGVTIPYVAPGVTMSWFVYVVRLSPEVDRTAVMRALQARGVPTRPYFAPIHLQPFYVQQFGFRPGDFPITERVARSTLALPFHNGMAADDVDYVVASLAKTLDALLPGKTRRVGSGQWAVGSEQ